jgi:hypothetical protein
MILAVLAGSSLGYAFERGDMCFHSTLRGLFRVPKQLDLFRAYITILLIAAPVVTIMRHLGWISPWIPPFNWQANLLGGIIFGVGMVVASSCITGFFYKAGHGMLGVLVGLATWTAGDILVYQGSLTLFRDELNEHQITVNGSPATLDTMFGSVGWIVLGVLWVIAALWLVRSPGTGRQTRGKRWGWLPLGLTIGLIISLSWLLARTGNANYPFGTSYVPTQIYLWLTTGAESSSWIPITLLSLIPGAHIAALRSGTLWLRGESIQRYFEISAGGFLMGVGAAVAGGCNLGHGLIGVPLLSLGSITTVLAMVAGVGFANWVAKYRKTRS